MKAKKGAYGIWPAWRVRVRGSLSPNGEDVPARWLVGVATG
jgi:hypothetical protein